VPVVTQADGDVAAVAQTYRFFGRLEARGRSAAYETLAESVADDTALLSFIASLPPEKRQPNLVFAAARYLLGAPPGIGSLRELASQSGAELTQVILARRTQTNEPARCAGHLPHLGPVVPHHGAAGAIRRHRPRPRRHLAVQRAARHRAGYGGTRPGRAYLRPGPRRSRYRPDREPCDLAAMAALSRRPRW